MRLCSALEDTVHDTGSPALEDTVHDSGSPALEDTVHDTGSLALEDTVHDTGSHFLHHAARLTHTHTQPCHHHHHHHHQQQQQQQQQKRTNKINEAASPICSINRPPHPTRPTQTAAPLFLVFTGHASPTVLKTPSSKQKTN